MNRSLAGTFDPLLDLQSVAQAPPQSFASAIEDIAPNVNTLVAQTNAPGEAWTDTLARLLPVLAATYQQRQLLQVQMERARAGLPPLDASQYAATVSVGADMGTKATALAIAGIALVGLLAFGMMSRR